MIISIQTCRNVDISLRARSNYLKLPIKTFSKQLGIDVIKLGPNRIVLFC